MKNLLTVNGKFWSQTWRKDLLIHGMVCFGEQGSKEKQKLDENNLGCYEGWRVMKVLIVSIKFNLTNRKRLMKILLRTDDAYWVNLGKRFESE